MKERKEKDLLQEGNQPIASPKLSTHPTPLRRLRRTNQKVNSLVLKAASYLMRVMVSGCLNNHVEPWMGLWRHASLPKSLEGRLRKGGNLFWPFLQARKGES